MDSFAAGLRSLAQESSSRGGGGGAASSSSFDGARLASGRSQVLIRAPPGYDSLFTSPSCSGSITAAVSGSGALSETRSGVPISIFLARIDRGG